MDVGGYRINYECFDKKSTYPMSINKGRATTTQSAHVSLVRIIASASGISSKGDNLMGCKREGLKINSWSNFKDNALSSLLGCHSVISMDVQALLLSLFKLSIL